MPDNSFLGPSAPWMIGEEDGYVYRVRRDEAVQLLVDALEARLARLKAHPNLDNVLLELRREMASRVADGDLGSTDHLVFLYYELMEARTNL